MSTTYSDSVSEYSQDIMRGSISYHLKNFQAQPSLTGHHFNRSFTFPAYEEIYYVDIIEGKEVGRNRIIQIIPGEKSIFKDEQSESAQDPLKKRPSDITFMDGWFHIHPTEVNTIKFMELTDHCEDKAAHERLPNKKVKFTKYDPNKIAKEKIDAQKIVIEAQNMVYTMDIEKELLPYAKVLNVHKPGMKPDELRYMMSEIAKRDPETFLRGLKDDRTKRKYHIITAIERGLLVKDGTNNNISWSNGGVIFNAPIGTNAIDGLVDMTFTKHGEDVFHNIFGALYPENQEKDQKLVEDAMNRSKERKKKESEEKQDEDEDANQGPKLDTEQKKLTAKAEEVGLITISGPKGNWIWVKYMDESIRIKDFLKRLEDETFLEEFKKNMETVKGAKA